MNITATTKIVNISLELNEDEFNIIVKVMGNSPSDGASKSALYDDLIRFKNIIDSNKK